MSGKKAGKKSARRPLRVLFVSSEAFPLVKTGGLGDVSHDLPNALAGRKADLRVLLPAYREVLRQVEDLQILGWLDLGPLGNARILQAYHPDFRMPLWLVDRADLFDREGNPYIDPNGRDWEDNPLRFTVFSRAAALLGIDALGLGWRPDVVHANDWQSGLAHAFLEAEGSRPRRIYTIHNLAYDCQFDYARFQALKLPPHWWSMEHAEFYGRFSLMKAGLVFSDLINTVSPTYAREICTPEYGYGYAGILRHYCDKLHGILNGIDTRIWDPQRDRHLVAHYGPDDDLAKARRRNRGALLQAMGYPLKREGMDGPLVGFVGRLVYQKGIDLLLDAAPGLLRDSDACLAIVGAGEAALEARLRELEAGYPGRVFIHLGYSEPLGHLLEAGADIFAMPSRYEPCGLNQMYSLHYGTPPVVRRTGGLADTVVDATPQAIEAGSANGFVFDEPTPEALAGALRRAIEAHADPLLWRQLQQTGMRQDFGWARSAQAYLDLYHRVIRGDAGDV
jgi:starch synthase